MNQAEPTSTASEAEQNARYRRNAIRTGLVIFVLGSLLLAIQYSQLGTIDGAVVLTAVATIAGLVCAILSYQNRVMLGVRILVVSWMTLLVGSNLFVQGLGIITAIVMIVTISGITRLTLPEKWTPRAIPVSIFLGVIAVLIDLFGSPERRAPSNEAAINILGLILILIYGMAQLSHFPRFRLRTKLVVTITGISILAVTAVIATVTISTRDTLTDTAGNTLYNLAGSQALGIGEQLSRQINSLEALALNKALQDSILARTGIYRDQSTEEAEASVAELEQQWAEAANEDRLVLLILNNTTSNELERFRQTFPNHIDLLLTDRYGALVAATDRPQQYDLSDERWWQETYVQGFGSSYVGEPYYSDRWNDVLIDIAVPIRVENPSGGGSLIGGILKSSFRIDSFVTLLEQAAFGETGVVELHVKDNVEVGRNEGQDVALFPVDPEEVAVLDFIKESDEVFVRDTFHDTESLISVAGVNTLAQEPRVNGLGWYIISYQTQDEALAPVDVQQRNTIILGIGVILVAVFIAAAGGEILTRPITELTETAVKVTGGDLTARATISRLSAEDEIGVLASSINLMTDSLSESIGGLEERVNERTRALETSTEVGRQLSTILSEEELVKEVVNQVRNAFDYYHVHIYLLDKNKNILRMAGGTGKAGQQMLARQHQIGWGQGLVGQAAAQNSAVLVSDVSKDPVWLPNPLLPDTKSEMAVPIAIGDEIFGVLDVQQNITNGLQETDVDLLLSITNQVASSLRNARLYAETHQQVRQQATINEINQPIQGAGDVQTALQIAIREVGRAVGAKHTIVRLVGEQAPTNGHNGHDQETDIA